MDFTQSQKEPIRSGKHLSKIMGGRAQRIRDNVRQFLVTQSDKNAELVRLYETFKKLLVHDLTTDAFADMYAQTLVYGLFVARYNDETKKDFSRQEARDLIPKSNPLLQHFFDHITGLNFDKRLEYIVNELCEIFSHADVQELMKEYFKDDLWGKTQKGPDPVIHFYEDFLKEYDPNLRKKMGAYYTPLPVVQFIVRSVDHLLEKEFGLVAGLADTSKTTDGIHKVQILDPAVGTGTFISDIIRKIYTRILKNKQEGRWLAYVHNDLLPRLHGFELMMTPYTIAHLKLGMAFRKTGFKYFNQRLGIYLTNSLEEGITQEGMFTGFGFAESIAEESKEASVIKNKTPIMVVIGNPPYSISSSNKGEWIQNLIKDYKNGLGERKINLDDDYIKFIRFAEHFIEKNKTGIVAMITNNSFIDGITHRQMRKHLLETFDDIYILDLHGNSKKKEKALDGGKDENVFDIQQGVSINIFIRKTKDKKNLGTVYHSELFGKREIKFETLNDSDLDKIKWQKLDYSEPYYFFVPKDFGANEEYEKGFSINDIFTEYNSGIQTKRDDLAISFTKNEQEQKVKDVLNLEEGELKNKYNLPEDGRDWKMKWAKNDLTKSYIISNILYRPLDTRFTAYTPRSKGLIAYPREKINKYIVNKDNITLLTSRSIPANSNFDRVFITKDISDIHASSDQTYIFPLYLYIEDETKIPNLKKEIVLEIEKIIGKITPEDIMNYIYATLHSPNYREKYKEFLKIDFPRVPYPTNKKQFDSLVTLGRELREIHLLESSKVSQFITTYPIVGSGTVEKISYKDGKVYINTEQYFGNVPEIAWNFYIGGYQPAQKWLKDRKDHTLSNSDIEHYQKIIVALVETERIMKEINKIL
ncbi:MAG: adenine-specific DNA methyltransferase [Candidatus Nomurabacteria bacterium GW2011_GWA1_36_15]|uniref:site-specific DNA-methyltransferase (adenine-specific) n=2 Tax=Candidatus Nomuraibacteriota TaxID=1752729 RepID=A0A0G0DXE4_9BACT|nr:MAG: adenine-specific DNA methyltransferase [Candidatus Nomurabacteria bacterium GW2011_GWA1_36_15]